LLQHSSLVSEQQLSETTSLLQHSSCVPSQHLFSFVMLIALLSACI